MYIDPKIARTSYLWHTYKTLLANNEYNISEIAEKMWTSQPNLSNALNWKKSFSDKFFTKIWKAIWLTDREIKAIFKEADKEEYKYKYWEDIEDIWSFDVILSREYWINDKEAINDIKKYLEFIKEKYWA